MHYFAYGSNLNLEHMRRVCGWHFAVLGVATLPDYEFVADARGFATIRRQAGKHVSGVLYEIDQFCLDALDRFEGHPEVFGRVGVVVKDLSGRLMQAWVYAEPVGQMGKFIRESYFRLVLTGAQENHLPKEWIEYLMSFDRSE